MEFAEEALFKRNRYGMQTEIMNSVRVDMTVIKSRTGKRDFGNNWFVQHWTCGRTTGRGGLYLPIDDHDRCQKESGQRLST